jgi:cytoskeleton protein RodZ
MIHEQNSSNVGLYLRDCRRAKAISLEEVAGSTKIRLVMLRQVENGDLNQIPPTYVKGFIRAYAEAVGADVKEAFRRFESSRTIDLRLEQAQAPAKASGSRFWPRLLAVVVLFVVLIASTLTIANRMQRPAPAPGPAQQGEQLRNELKPAGIVEPDSAAIAAAPSDVELSLEMPAADTPAAAGQDPAQLALPVPATHPESVGGATSQHVDQHLSSRQLVLHLTAIEQTWLRVTRDNGPPRELTLKVNEKVTLEAQQRFELLIGNAGGIRMKLNDEPERVAGAKGKVVKLVLP